MGSKWRLAPWIVSHFAAHDQYVELYGGSAAVLLAKGRSRGETLNDLDEDVVLFYRVLRDETAAICRVIALTPWSRREFEYAAEMVEEPLERVRRFLVRSWQGMAGWGCENTGWRTEYGLTNWSLAKTWTVLPERLETMARRLRGVRIECRDAVELLERAAGKQTLVYADPPYAIETLGAKLAGGRHYYRQAGGADAAASLLAALRRHPGPVVLSGYDCASWSERLGGWEKRFRKERNMAGKTRVECLWLNRSSAEQLQMEL